MKVLSLALVAVFMMGGSARAQEKPAGGTAAPSLTVEQKQGIQILAQRIELAQLRAQAAQLEFDKARGELSTLLQSLQRDGFELNLQTMEYTKKLEPPKAPEKAGPGKVPGGGGDVK